MQKNQSAVLNPGMWYSFPLIKDGYPKIYVVMLTFFVLREKGM